MGRQARSHRPIPNIQVMLLDGSSKNAARRPNARVYSSYRVKRGQYSQLGIAVAQHSAAQRSAAQRSTAQHSGRRTTRCEPAAAPMPWPARGSGRRAASSHGRAAARAAVRGARRCSRWRTTPPGRWGTSPQGDGSAARAQTCTRKHMHVEDTPAGRDTFARPGLQQISMHACTANYTGKQQVNGTKQAMPRQGEFRNL